MNKNFLIVFALALLVCIGTTNCGKSMRGKSRKGGGGQKTAERRRSRRRNVAEKNGRVSPPTSQQSPQGQAEVAALLSTQPSRPATDRPTARKANAASLAHFIAKINNRYE